MNGDIARIAIVLAGVVLGVAEWMIIRKTDFNKWALPLVFWTGALVYGVVVGPDPVLLPSFMLALCVLLCAVEEWIREYLRKRGMSAVDRTRTMDL